MKRILTLSAFAALAVLAACAEMQPPTTEVAAPVSPAPAPVAASAPAPSRAASTAEALDTTTAEQRAAAVAPAASAGGERLGTTIASLGSPADPGLWLETPLVSAVTPGRVETAAGKSVKLELRPSGGAAGAGSQISLPAMRLLEVSLTSLPELTVFRD